MSSKVTITERFFAVDAYQSTVRCPLLSSQTCVHQV